ncbi:MAG: nucleoside diphosphate kinase regulator [Sulfitobacter sp.]
MDQAQEKMPSNTPAKRRPRLVISAEDMAVLEPLAEGAMQRNRALAERLLEELLRAKIVPQAKLAPGVVALGRRLRYRDDSTGQEKTVTLVRPQDADIGAGAVSVMTPIGVALIGLAAGATIHWETREGQRRLLTVLQVGEE